LVRQWRPARRPAKGRDKDDRSEPALARDAPKSMLLEVEDGVVSRNETNLF
jgi:hypothetical protein